MYWLTSSAPRLYTYYLFSVQKIYSYRLPIGSMRTLLRGLTQYTALVVYRPGLSCSSKYPCYVGKQIDARDSNYVACSTGLLSLANDYIGSRVQSVKQVCSKRSGSSRVGNDQYHHSRFLHHVFSRSIVAISNHPTKPTTPSSCKHHQLLRFSLPTRAIRYRPIFAVDV